MVIGQLVTDDHRPAGSGLARRLELLSELAAAAIHPHRHAGVAQARGDSQPIGMVLAEADHRNHRRRGWHGHLLLLHGENRSVQADPEADARGRATAEELHQPVIPAATTQRLLLPLAPGDHELERGARVVVQPADEPMIDDVSDSERIEQVEDAPEVRAALLAQVVDALRSPIGQVRGQLLVVKDTQRVDLEPSARARKGKPPS